MSNLPQSAPSRSDFLLLQANRSVFLNQEVYRCCCLQARCLVVLCRSCSIKRVLTCPQTLKTGFAFLEVRGGKQHFEIEPGNESDLTKGESIMKDSRKSLRSRVGISVLVLGLLVVIVALLALSASYRAGIAHAQ